MPWVNITTSREVPKPKQDEVAEGMAHILEEVIGKERSGVFVSFVEANSLYWGGERTKEAAFFDIRWIGRFGHEHKRQITDRVCRELAGPLGADRLHMRVLYTEKTSEDWGRPG